MTADTIVERKVDQVITAVLALIGDGLDEGWLSSQDHDAIQASARTNGSMDLYPVILFVLGRLGERLELEQPS
jgi:hypothetical protein